MKHTSRANEGPSGGERSGFGPEKGSFERGRGFEGEALKGGRPISSLANFQFNFGQFGEGEG